MMGVRAFGGSSRFVENPANGLPFVAILALFSLPSCTGPLKQNQTEAPFVLLTMLAVAVFVVQKLRESG